MPDQGRCGLPRETSFDRIGRLTQGLPDVTEGTNYGQPALKVGGKAFATLKNETTLVLRCTLEEKDVLLELAPEIYWQTDHYRGWPGLLVRLDVISDEELKHRLGKAHAERSPPPARVRRRRIPE
jgi:hypothetical protein